MRGLKIQAGGGSRLYPSGSSASGSPFTPQAQAFITATGITDPTQQAAINQLTITLIADGLWDLMQAIYPNVGGTQDTCKYNLKDPRDLDAAFRKTYAGGLTFADTGVTGNGSTGYANTHYSPATHGTNNSIHISFYSRTNSAASNVTIGCGAWFAAGDAVVLSPTGTAGPTNAYTEVTGIGAVNVAVSDSFALFTATRTASTTFKLFQRGAELGNNATAGVSIAGTTDAIYVHARNNGGVAANFSPNESAFETIGLGLSDANVVALYTAIQTFNTTLNREV